MTGETNLATLLRSLKPEISADTFVFCTVGSGYALPDGDKPILCFSETEGYTLILTMQQAEHVQLPYIFPCKRITLKVHSSLEAIGMMAAISAKLASNGISVNPVSGYYHDHLFVPADKANLAMKLLQEFAND